MAIYNTITPPESNPTGTAPTKLSTDSAVPAKARGRVLSLVGAVPVGLLLANMFSKGYAGIMSILEWVNTAIVAVGVPAIATTLVVIGRKLQVLDSLQQEVDNNIRPDLKDVRERFATLEGKYAGLFQSQSPISLTHEGKRYLQESGLKEFIDEHKDVLMQQCNHDQTMQTPYDVQQVAFEFFDELDLPDSVEQQVKTFAFNHGVSMEAMRRIAGIYFRDLCLRTHGFRSEDIDGEHPEIFAAQD